MKRLPRLLTTMALGALLGMAAGAENRIADISEGTNLALALSPDGQTLAVSLLGGLWRLPVTGGAAHPLVPAGSGIHNPRFDPEGRRLVYQKRDGGQWDLWSFDLTTGEQRALTSTPHDERQPDFAAGGARVVFSSDAAGASRLSSLDLETGTVRRLSYGIGDDTYPSVSAAGDVAFVNRRDGLWSLRVLSPDGGIATVLRSRNALTAPSWRPGGGVITFHERESADASVLRMLVMDDDVPVLKRLTDAEDVFTSRIAWRSPARFVYAADGRIWRRGIAAAERAPVHLFAAVGVDDARPEPVSQPLDAAGPFRAAGIGGWTAAPDGERFAFTALGDLWLADGDDARRLTDDAHVDKDPRFTPDGERIVFASDRGGKMDLWQLDLAPAGESAAPARLTRDAGRVFAPAVDAAGRRVAFLSTRGTGPWAASELKVLHLDGSRRVDTLASNLVDASGLAWDADAPVARDAAPAAAPALAEDAAPTWSPRAGQTRYVVQVGRLFDGVRTGYRRHMDIHIDRQRITAIAARGTLPAEGEIIDAREATVIPGLVDVHVHQSSLSGAGLGRQWLAHGVTTVRELAHDLPEALERGESWAAGRRLGPRLVIAPTHRALAGGPVIEPASPVIVQTASRLPDGFGHTLRTGVAAPAPLAVSGAASPLALPDLGTPNGGLALRVSPLNRSYQDTVGTVIASATYLSTSLGAANSTGGDIRPLQDTLARVVRNGGRVATGSDAPAVPYGEGLLRELELLAESGLANDQVLRIATAEGAMALGLARQIGTLEEGKLADFVVLDGDPLERIGDVRHIRAVVRGGEWFPDETLSPGR